MKFERFSKKQLMALTWWHPDGQWSDRQAVICDGAVRSGKTICLSLSFVFWAFAQFDSGTFAICGKTVTALRRNVVAPLISALEPLGFDCCYKVSAGSIDISFCGKSNRFYLFGGKDEGSAALIQGITLAGILFDEVALMPRSFVEQGLARCSVEGSRFWFNCNPSHPAHWFYREWICGRKEKNALYIHFEMADNPSLSTKMLKRYSSLYTGVFYERYVRGRWVAAHGAVYPMFSQRVHVVNSVPSCSRYVISCDYGTRNPASFGLWGFCEGVWYRLREYYHSGRDSGIIKTDEQYADELENLAEGYSIEAVLVDPSAASFIQCLRVRGKFNVLPAKNRVMDGIRLVAGALHSGSIKIHHSCKDIIREFSLYRWNLEAQGDAPIQQDDHAMDDMRYFAMYALGAEEICSPVVRAVNRKQS